MIKILDILRKIKDLDGQRKVWNFEKNKYKKFCSDSIWKSDSMTSCARDIIILGHTIEKGLSHQNIKPRFGMDVARRLAEKLNSYVNYEKIDVFVIQIGVSILDKYINANVNVGVSKEDLPQLRPELEKYKESNVGAYLTNGYQFFLNSQEAFDQLACSRRTMRLYDSTSKEISSGEIRKIIEIATNSPSACNRQAVRIHIITEHDKIKKLCDVQGGARGFGENAGALLIITADLRFYTMAERRLPMYDCGLFSMNLLYAAYQQKLGCCILNGSFNKIQEKKCNDIVKIESNELISSFILLNKVEEQEEFLVAKSERRKVDDIIIS